MPSLSDRIIERLTEGPNERALGHMDRSGNTQWVTRDDLLRRARTAGDFLQEKGVEKADTCILRVEDEAATVLTLSVVLIGAIPLLLPPANLRRPTLDDGRVLARIIGTTQARSIVSGATEPRTGEGSTGIEDGGVRHISAAEAMDQDGSTVTAYPRCGGTHGSDDAIALLQATSGTTGVPKICAWTHRAILDTLDNTAVAVGLSTEDIFFNWTPLYHDLGLVNNFLLCLLHGIPLVNLNPTEFVKNPLLWIRGMSSVGATMTFAPNFGFAYTARKVQDKDLDGVDLRAVRAMWNAAERVHCETMREFLKRFVPHGLRPSALKTSYGLAENVGGATFSDLSTTFSYERIDRTALEQRGRARVVAKHDSTVETVEIAGVGKAAPGVEIEIRSRTGSGRPLEDGQVGEIVVRADSKMHGYLQDAGATDGALRAGLIWTGDLGYLREKQLFWVGRKKERITVRGRKLDPSDFEQCLLDIPGLRNGSFVAFGQDDAHSGTQRVVIIAEEVPGSGVAQDKIAETVRSRAFDALGVSVRVVLVPKGSLLKTTSGKRRHQHYRRAFEEGEFDS